MEWRVPSSIDEACDLLVLEGARAVAGCSSQTPRMIGHDPDATVCVDLRAIPELRGVKVEADQLTIGAMTTMDELASMPTVSADTPMLCELAHGLGDEVLRRHATVGGNVAARCGWELPAALVALGARFQTADRNGLQWHDSRELCAPDFVLGRGQLLTCVVVPVHARRAWKYRRAVTSAGYFVGSVALVREGDGLTIAVAGGAAQPVKVAPGSAVPELPGDAVASSRYRTAVLNQFLNDVLEEIAA